MWKLAFVWIGAVILFFVIWALATKAIRRICEKRDAEKQEETSITEDNSTHDNLNS